MIVDSWPSEFVDVRVEVNCDGVLVIVWPSEVTVKSRVLESVVSWATTVVLPWTSVVLDKEDRVEVGVSLLDVEVVVVVGVSEVVVGLVVVVVGGLEVVVVVVVGSEVVVVGDVEVVVVVPGSLVVVVVVVSDVMGSVLEETVD